MPEISRFKGIVIVMYLDEGVHQVAHFHARYAGHRASVRTDGTVSAGHLPTPQLKLVAEWASLHAEQITANWDRLRNEQQAERIAPLP